MRRIIAVLSALLAFSMPAHAVCPVITEGGVQKTTCDQVYTGDITFDGTVNNPAGPKIRFTEEGGFAILLTNKTGAASVKGTIVEADTTTDNAFKASAASSDDPIGIVYEAGVADGSECWVVIYGIAEVLLKDTTASTRGYWVMTSDAAGRADATNAAPPGFVASHFQEIGHCIESKTAGTDVLAKIVMHFN